MCALLCMAHEYVVWYIAFRCLAYGHILGCLKQVFCLIATITVPTVPQKQSA